MISGCILSLKEEVLALMGDKLHEALIFEIAEQ